MNARLTLLLLALGALFVFPHVVFAHADLVSSTPASGATVATAPAKVTAVFDEELETSGSTLTVVDATGKRVDAGDGKVDLDDLDRKTMIVSLKSGLGAGTYTVRWTAASGEDGDTTSGSFSFTVKPEGSGEGAQPTPTRDPDPKALPATAAPIEPPLWLGLGALLLAAGGAALLLQRVRA